MSEQNWNNNELQFARLISEINAAGGFTTSVINDLCVSMDLSAGRILELIERAERVMNDALGSEEIPDIGEHFDSQQAQVAKRKSSRN